jgi:hypothetical protein
MKVYQRTVHSALPTLSNIFEKCDRNLTNALHPLLTHDPLGLSSSNVTEAMRNCGFSIIQVLQGAVQAADNIMSTTYDVVNHNEEAVEPARAYAFDKVDINSSGDRSRKLREELLKVEPSITSMGKHTETTRSASIYVLEMAHQHGEVWRFALDYTQARILKAPPYHGR